MCASLETLVIAAYVFATTLPITRRGPEGRVTDHELIALAVAQAVTGLCSDRQFLGTIDRLLPGMFSVLPDQSQYNRRLRRLAPQLTQVQLHVAELIAQDPDPARRRDADRLRELPRLPAPQRVRRLRQLRLLPV